MTDENLHAFDKTVDKKGRALTSYSKKMKNNTCSWYFQLYDVTTFKDR